MSTATATEPTTGQHTATCWSPHMRFPCTRLASCPRSLTATLVVLQFHFTLASVLLAGPESNTEPASASPAKTTTQTPSPTSAERDEAFKKLVTNVRLVGNFTLDGAEEAKLQREEYVINGAMKLGNNDLWALMSRIKYGDVDLTLPVPVQVKWAGNTPVITVDSVAIPGLGTFSARVLLDKARYAGTWRHDEKGGHLFGVMKPDEPEQE